MALPRPPARHHHPLLQVPPARKGGLTVTTLPREPPKKRRGTRGAAFPPLLCFVATRLERRQINCSLKCWRVRTIFRRRLTCSVAGKVDCRVWSCAPAGRNDRAGWSFCSPRARTSLHCVSALRVGLLGPLSSPSKNIHLAWLLLMICNDVLENGCNVLKVSMTACVGCVEHL